MNKKIGITLPNDVYEKLDNISIESGMAKSNIMKMLLMKYLDKEFMKGE